MEVSIPQYKGYFVFDWMEKFEISCSIDSSCVRIEANKEGLISLARHLLELAQDDVPQYVHFHLDDSNSLDDGSAELIISKR